MSTNIKTAMATILLIFGLLTTATASAESYIVVHGTLHRTPSALIHVDAKPETVTIYTVCYHRGWLYPHTLYIPCDFTVGVSYPSGPLAGDIKANGGHEHDYHTRPLVYRKRHFVPTSLGPKPVYDGPGKLKYAFDKDPSNLSVAGKTVMNDGAIIHGVTHYTVPEVSGQIIRTTTLTTPGSFAGWYWLLSAPSGKYTKSLHWVYTLNVGLRGLIEVPDPGPKDHYEKVRSHDENHPDNVAYYIQAQYLPQLYHLSNAYYRRTERVLSLNDMTLPEGGLFDINGNWETPHKSHRNGTDADVNRQGTNPTSIDCIDSIGLIKPARVTIPHLRDKFGTGGNTDSAILCENGGKYIHIDFAR